MEAPFKVQFDAEIYAIPEQGIVKLKFSAFEDTVAVDIYWDKKLEMDRPTDSESGNLANALAQLILCKQAAMGMSSDDDIFTSPPAYVRIEADMNGNQFDYAICTKPGFGRPGLKPYELFCFSNYRTVATEKEGQQMLYLGLDMGAALHPKFKERKASLDCADQRAAQMEQRRREAVAATAILGGFGVRP